MNAIRNNPELAVLATVYAGLIYATAAICHSIPPIVVQVVR